MNYSYSPISANPRPKDEAYFKRIPPLPTIAEDSSVASQVTLSKSPHPTPTV